MDAAPDRLRNHPPRGSQVHLAAALYATGDRDVGDELTRPLLPYARERLRTLGRGW